MPSLVIWNPSECRLPAPHYLWCVTRVGVGKDQPALSCYEVSAVVPPPRACRMLNGSVSFTCHPSFEKAIKHKAFRPTTDKWDLIKLKSLCIANDTITWVKHQSKEWEKSLAAIHLTEGWCLEHTKNWITLNTMKTAIWLKLGVWN